MPELPEAETIRRQLAREVVGRTIQRLEVHVARAAREQGSPAALRRLVAGRRIIGVGRRGKAVLLHLDDRRALTLIVRLGMTGLLRLVSAGHPPERGVCATLELDDARAIQFVDQRQFGGLVARPGHDPEGMPEFAHYGPEPLSEELTPEYLKEALGRRRAGLETVLMDQRVIAGIGKIYADEICFRAGLRPGRAARRLTGPMRERLLQAIREVLAEAIAARGSSARDETFRDLHGRPGSFQQRLYVYQRTGEPCLVCGTPIRRTPMPGGRGMHWCPRCQQ